jgi:hypothetical protein
MIKVPQPAMVLNSHNVPSAKYRMENTWDVGKNESPQKILGWVAHVLSGFDRSNPERDPITLIINSHGLAQSGRGGYGIAIGTGIRRADIVQFEKLARKGQFNPPLADEIWFIACQAAFIDNAGGGGDGNLLMSGIAKAAQARVKASTANQQGDLWLPRFYVDDWEGTVYTYGPYGSVVNVEYD